MTGSGESVLVTARSAWVMTAVVCVAESFAALASVVVVVAVAVLLTVPPWATFGLTRTTKVNVASAPATRVVMNALAVPLPPAGGTTRLKAGPEVWLADTNVVLAGTASLRVTFCASDGPLLVTMIVYVTFSPAL